ncbi:MAG: fibronectin type III domain-containing protein [Gemmatimonadota bacterium]
MRRLGALAGLLLLLPAPLAAQKAPNPPVNLEAEPSAHSVRLTWDEDTKGKAASAFFFRVYRNDVLIANTFDEDFDDTGLPIETTYTYAVAAVDFSGRSSGLSDPVTTRTRDESPPSEPKDLVAQAISSSRIDLSWKASQDDDSGISGYYVYRNGGSEPHDSTVTPAYSDTGLAGFTEYSYEISAVNLSGVESERGKKKSARTLDGSPPTTPSNLIATAVSGSRIDLSWSAASDSESGVARYYVYRNGAATPVDSATGTSYSDTGLSGSSLRTYRVAAVNGAGLVSAKSASASARPLDVTAPTAPADLTATANGARLVDLGWKAASDPESGIQRYLIYRNGGSSPLDSTTARTYADADVEPETSYTYRVSARNGIGLEGAQSSLAAITTPVVTDATPPSTPGTVRPAAVSQGGVELSWPAAEDEESGIAFYRVFRDDVMIATPATPTYTDTDVEVGTTYVYEIAAVNGEGIEGPRSAPLEVTVGVSADLTPPAAPSGLRVIIGS